MHRLEDVFTTGKMAKILEILQDGKWHTLEEIRERTELEEKKIQQVMDFLGKYCFVMIDKTRKRVMLDRAFEDFLGEKSSS